MLVPPHLPMHQHYNAAASPVLGRTGFFARTIISLVLLMLSSISAADSQSGSPIRILAFGDSLTAGLGLSRSDNFPSQLQAALHQQGYRVEVVNGGDSGGTTTGGLARLEWMLGDPVDAVIVALGANDALRAVAPELVRSNIDEILMLLSGRNLPVLLCGFKAPRNLGKDYIDQFDALYPALAKKHSPVFYPHFLEGVATDFDLNQADGIHPNAAGVAAIVEGMLPSVFELIEQVNVRH